MRLRVGAVLCLFLGFIGAGCRKTLAPSTLDNQPPETWIVAAPQDTITTRDDQNTPVRPRIGQIPVRFHLYWAGSDRDGTVGGYYWAVVETLPIPPEGQISVPSLPGPKARDYHFTTKTDSIFIFRASEEVSERQHAFYIYAVDNKGRPDPTPARFVFSAYDKYPPKAIIDELRAEGTEYELLPGGGVRAQRKTYFVTDFFEISNDHPVPRDTIPADAFMTMRWHGEPTIPSTVVTGYRYKLDETDFNTVDSSVHTASYNSGIGADKVNPGPKVFTLRAIGQSGWRGEATRWFQMNFAPDTWFAGPDLDDPLAGWQSYLDGNGKRYWYKDFSATGWTGGYTGVPGTMLSEDSVDVLPALRPQRKTFFEVYNDRLWAHAENDTVHLNSWVIIPSGGFDRDSPYNVRVNQALLPGPLQGKVVLTQSGPNGSPIGFRLRIPVKDAGGGVSQPSETTTYPEFDPASVKHQPIVNGVQGMTTAGRAFAELFAEDGNGTVDRRIDQRPGGSRGIVERVEAGTGNAQDNALRSKILTFYVNKVPRLLRSSPAFRPTPNQSFNSRSLVLNLPAEDVDPLDPSRGFNVVGGRPAYEITRRKVAILGKLAGTTRDTCYVDPSEFVFASPITIEVPTWIASGNITVRIRLCDCQTCDVGKPTPTCPFTGDRGPAPGYGSCIEVDIPARITAAEPALNETGSPANPGPGSAESPGRRQQ